MTGRRLAAALLASAVLSGAGVAGAQSTRTTTDPSSSPGGHHSVSGEVTRVDAKKGWVHLKTNDGTMIVHFPPDALTDVKKGDRLNVDIALKDTGPAPKK